MYKIGLSKKEAEELTNEMKNNFTNQKKFLKQQEAEITQGEKKDAEKKKLLPLEAYKQNAIKPRNVPESSDLTKDDKVKHSQSLLKFLMKEADQLYRTVGENQDKFDMYQVRLMNSPLTPARIDYIISLKMGRRSNEKIIINYVKFAKDIKSSKFLPIHPTSMSPRCLSR